MKEKILYAVWGCLYILCVGLGCVTDPHGAGKVLLVLTGIIFFIPGAIILADALKSRNKKAVLRIRWISLTSLCLTLLLLILNFLSLEWSVTAGKILHEVLILVSSPMFCCQYWVLSLFLWACLMVASFKKIKK